MAILKPCPFCGGKCDPEGWVGTEADRKTTRSGPACDDCGASAPSLEMWNKRAIDTSLTGEEPLGTAGMTDDEWAKVILSGADEELGQRIVDAINAVVGEISINRSTVIDTLTQMLGQDAGDAPANMLEPCRRGILYLFEHYRLRTIAAIVADEEREGAPLQ